MRRLKTALYSQNAVDGRATEAPFEGEPDADPGSWQRRMRPANGNGNVVGLIANSHLYEDPFAENNYRNKEPNERTVQLLMDKLRDPQQLRRMTRRIVGRRSATEHSANIDSLEQTLGDFELEEKEDDVKQKDNEQSSSSTKAHLFHANPYRFLSRPLRKYVSESDQVADIERELWPQLVARPTSSLRQRHYTHQSVMDRARSWGCELRAVQGHLVRAPFQCDKGDEESTAFWQRLRADNEAAFDRHCHWSTSDNLAETALLEIQWLCGSVARGATRRSQELFLHVIYHVVTVAGKETSSPSCPVMLHEIKQAVEKYEERRQHNDLHSTDALMEAGQDATACNYVLCLRNYYFSC